ncbi:MAG: DMT family transporter [bacterium]|nr:DMT family transporter [bacterium]
MNAAPEPNPSAPTLIHNRIVGMTLLLLSQVMFGTTFAVNKLVLNQAMDPILLAFARTTLGWLFLLPFFLMYRGSQRWTPAKWRLGLMVGMVSAPLAMMAELTGTHFSTASNASLILSIESLVAMVLSVWLLKEQPTRRMVAGLFIACMGMWFVLSRHISHVEFHFGSALFGDFLLFCAVFAWSFYTVLGKPLTEDVNPIYSVFFVLVFASITLGSISLVQGTWGEFPKISLQAWKGIVFLGVIGTGLPQLLYFQALKRLMASTVSLSLTFQPVCGVFFAFLLLGEILSLSQAVGAVLVVFGIGYAVWVCRR